MRTASESVDPGSEDGTVRDTAVGDTAVGETAPTLAVNGTLRPLETGTTVEDLVATWCSSPDGVAVARNREVVPRSQWSLTSLEAGDLVEIVSAAAGG